MMCIRNFHPETDMSTRTQSDGLAHRKKPLGIGQGVGCIGESTARGRQEELQFAVKHRFNVLHVVVVPEFPCGMSTAIFTLLQSPLFTMLSP